MYKKFLISVLILFSLSLSACSPKVSSKEQPFSQSQFLMDTLCTITLYEEDPEVMEGAFQVIREIENKMSNTIEQSEISQINRSSGKKEVTISPDTFQVLQVALEYSDLSKGSFDISIAPLIDLWNITSEQPKIPLDAEIKALLPKVNRTNILLNEKASTAFLKEEGMKLDLGGIAKGYAADAVGAYLSKKGVERAVINLGGNIYVHGQKKDSSPWNIGVQDPTTSQEKAIATLKIESDTAVVTSGVYQRYFEKDGKIYHHILNPKDGKPIENGLISVTVVTKESVRADALSTTLFSLGLKEGMELINLLDNVSAIFITKDKKIYMSDALKDKFEILDNRFSVTETIND